MNVSLTPYFEEFVKQKVESGLYSSASEVVRDALRLLDEKEKKLADLRQAIQEGLDSGPAVPADFEALKAKARKIHEEQQSIKADD